MASLVWSTTRYETGDTYAVSGASADLYISKDTLKLTNVQANGVKLGSDSSGTKVGICQEVPSGGSRIVMRCLTTGESAVITTNVQEGLRKLLSVTEL